MEYNFKPVSTGTTFNSVSFQLIVNGSPKDITGALITIQTLNKTFNTTGGGITITDPTAGRFRLNSFLVTLPVGSHPYKMTIKFANGTVKKYMTGFFVITK